MHIYRLMKCINQLDHEHNTLMQCVINDVLQEIMDSESFHDNGPRAVSTKQLLDEITAKTNEPLAQMIVTCVVEFCITNYYPFNETSWNFINHYLKYYKEHLTTKEQKYLAALNNSHMTIYKVVSVVPGQSVTLEDRIDTNNPKITVLDKQLSHSIEKGQHVAMRPIPKTVKGKSREYDTSSSIVIIPPPILDNCINTISNITNLMLASFGAESTDPSSNKEVLEDTKHNRLLIKKMWVKEILENIYDYYSNYANYHTILDYDGNPWHPCVIEFDLLTTLSKIKNALFSVKEFEYDQSSRRSSNVWLWLSNKYTRLDQKNIKAKLPSITENLEKPPIFNGAFITNEYDGTSYHIYAEIRLVKNKLLVEVNSKQRANIAQDKLLTKLAGMITNPIIHSRH